MSLDLFAPAKVNLTLRVGRARADGRHPLDSLVGFTRRIGDHLSIERSANLTLEIEGPFGHGLSVNDDNLILRAAKALEDFAKQPVGAHINLQKNLPIASGIGGGSADAAAALIGLNNLLGTGLTQTQLCKIGSKLGADVPACIMGTPLRMVGTGEEIVPLNKAARLGIVLVNPLVECPTGPVYRRFDEMGLGQDLSDADWPDIGNAQDLVAFLKETPNDLTSPAIALVPQIGDVLSAIATTPNILLRAMSGSGATCFGLYASYEEAARGAAALREQTGCQSFWIEADEIN